MVLPASFLRQGSRQWWEFYWHQLRIWELDVGLVSFCFFLVAGLAIHWFFLWIFMGTCPFRRQAPDPVHEPAARGRQQCRVNSPAQTARAIRRWLWAGRKVRRVLRLRRLWAALGTSLQDNWVQDLVLGLERRGGQLVRVRDSEREIARREAAAVAKARARLRARFTTSRTRSPQ